ncbi:MAG: hypothetical protein IPG25_06750 [Proteobacteria bacterium]|nr:hypothetical protein [Pseudomonadota bacterium]
MEEPLDPELFGRECNLLINVAALRKQNQHIIRATKQALNPKAPMLRMDRQILPDAYLGDTRGNYFAPLDDEQLKLVEALKDGK